MSIANFRRGAVLAAKLAVSGALLAFVLTQAGLGQYSSIFGGLSSLTIGSVVGIAVFQMAVISAWRLKLVLALLGRHIGVLGAARVTWCGFFFEQVGAAFIAGDIARVWLLRQGDIGVHTAASALLLDRGIGFVAIVAMAAFGLPSFWDALSRHQLVFLAVLVGSTGLLMLVAGVLIASQKLRSTVFRQVSRLEALMSSVVAVLRNQSRSRIAAVAVLALTTHGLNVLAMYLLLTDAGVAITLTKSFLLAPTAFLFSMLPVSISGWGMREGAFVLALTGFGAMPEQVIVASIVFGLSVLAAALPGAVMWLSLSASRSLDCRSEPSRSEPDRA